MKKIVTFTAIAVSLVLGACASVDVTKTAKGFYQATDPNTVEILKTRPAKNFDELGTITVTGFDADETAKMHNAIRAKSAPLGANAVILTEEGLIKESMFSYKRWATGVAIVYK
jgi:hypothetical protein